MKFKAIIMARLQGHPTRELDIGMLLRFAQSIRVKLRAQCKGFAPEARILMDEGIEQGYAVSTEQRGPLLLVRSGSHVELGRGNLLPTGAEIFARARSLSWLCRMTQISQLALQKGRGASPPQACLSWSFE